jgi:hypothetical protein
MRTGGGARKQVGCGFDAAVALRGSALPILEGPLAGHGPATASVAHLSRPRPHRIGLFAPERTALLYAFCQYTVAGR